MAMLKCLVYVGQYALMTVSSQAVRHRIHAHVMLAIHKKPTTRRLTCNINVYRRKFQYTTFFFRRIINFSPIPHRCTPKCDSCEYGTCIQPQFCACNSDYDWDSSINRCVPRCYHSCKNGYCSGPDHCECNDGYTWNAELNECVPICDPPCTNGKCIGSNQCECEFEYQFKNGSLHLCEPICEMSCLNAICIEPNVCECNEGFINHDKERPHECHCGKFCAHIDNKCVCLDEMQRVKGRLLYETNNTNSLTCNENHCVNGNCTIADAGDGGDSGDEINDGGPNSWHCECNRGYIKYDDFTCVEEEACSEMRDDGECSRWLNNSVPSSNTILCQCMNGICLTNNSCTCVGGYRISDENPNKCVPYCSLKCVSFKFLFSTLKYRLR